MAQSINLQITPNGVIPTIYASQFDVGREITFNLYDGSTAYTPPAGSTIRFEGKKSDGNGFSYNCTYVDNVVTMALTDQMTVFAEEVPCELRIADTDNNDIGTLNILLSVEKSPIDGNTPMSDTEIPAIIELARTEQYNAEAWAEGTRNGTPVGPTDPTYQNNAKYYAEHSSASVSSLSDTDIQNVADNQILVYDGVDSKWENKVNNINRLADVHILNPSDGQSLIYDANDDKWVNGSGGGGSSTLGGLTDVTLTTPANGQILQYDANDDEWVNANAPSGGGLLPYLYITTEADAMVFVRSNDYPDIYPTEVTTGHWECELPDYGLYTVHSDIEGDDATYTIDVDAVKEYSVTVMHYTHTINITVMSGASITITDGVETITGTGTGSSEAFTVHNASTVYTVTTSVDGASAPAQTVTTPAQSEQSTSLTFQYGTINLTYANEFRGLSISCSSGGTTITKTAPATGNSMAFYPPSTGTWVISGVYSGVTYYSNSVTITSLSTAESALLQTIPDGSTVTPINDVQKLLNCAGIFDKNYTTIGELLADSTSLLTVISDNNAVNYLVRSTGFASSVCANSTAMTDIGANNYCANTLLADSTWRTAICNSTYFESVLNKKVPTMTSDTAPSGSCFGSNPYTTGYECYKAFDGDLSEYNYYATATIQAQLGYEFTSQVCVNAVELTSVNRSGIENENAKTFKVQAYNGSTWVDLSGTLTKDSMALASKQRYALSNTTKYTKYRIQVLTNNGSAAATDVGALQFYGR